MRLQAVMMMLVKLFGPMPESEVKAPTSWKHSDLCKCARGEDCPAYGNRMYT